MSRSLVNTKLNSKYTAGGGGGGPSNPYTVGTIDSQTKSANGLVITGSNIVAQTADATNPGLVSTGAQTFAGLKNFYNGINISRSNLNSVENYSLIAPPNKIYSSTDFNVYFTLDGSAPSTNNVIKVRSGATREIWVITYQITAMTTAVITAGLGYNLVGDYWTSSVVSTFEYVSGTLTMKATSGYIPTYSSYTSGNSYFQAPVLMNSGYISGGNYAPGITTFNDPAVVFGGGAQITIGGTCGVTITKFSM